MKTIKAVKAWNYTPGNKGTVVAIIDTGVDQSLPDLKDAIFIPGYNFADGNGNTKDKQSHGSHVCSTVAEVSGNKIGGIGVAPGVTIMPVKVLDDSGRGTMEGVASGIVYAVDHGAHIINMSLGSPQKSAIVGKAVKYAYEKGVFVAVAAGNDASPIQGSPSADFGAFAVAATDKNDNLASFSSYGKELKISAPGQDILQNTIDRNGNSVYVEYSGTSMASPHVAGGAALLYSQGVTDPDAALRILQSSAKDKGNPNKFGAGILDVNEATFSVYYRHLLLRSAFLFAALFAILTILRKNSQSFVRGTELYTTLISAAASSIGLFFFLPMVGVLPYMGDFRWIGELLSRPFAEWDLIWSLDVHKWLPLASAFTPFAMVAFGYHNKIARSIAGGIAIGISAYLAQVCLSNEVTFILGQYVMRAWTVVNIAACLWVAKNCLKC